MVVNFMIIGAQKCGTTTLSEILRNHPSIVGCNVKEPHFFSETKNWRASLDEYHSLFKEVGNALYFEASTSYTFYPYRNLHIWDDIYEYNPDMKFIYLVRNPIDRIISGYVHAYEKGHTDLPFQETLVRGSFQIDITRYYSQIYPYIKKFGAENLLLIDFDDFINNRNEVLSQISEFLSVDRDKFQIEKDVHLNKSIGGKDKKHHKYDSPSFFLKGIRKLFPGLWEKITDNSDRLFDAKPQMSHEQKMLISNLLRLEIKELQKLMNKDLSHWLEGVEPLTGTLKFQKK